MTDHARNCLRVVAPPKEATLIFESRFEATQLAVREAVTGLRAALERQDILPDLAGSVEIAAAEALNNVTEHAYQEAQTGDVALATFIDPSTLHLSITDAGRPMPGGKIPAKTLRNLPDITADLPEGGFGWDLIKNLCEDVEYQRIEACNHLILRFSRDPSRD